MMISIQIYIKKKSPVFALFNPFVCILEGGRLKRRFANKQRVHDAAQTPDIHFK